MTDDRPWLIDAREGRVVLRSELLRELGQRGRLVCRPTGSVDALCEITRALLRSDELMLLDADFTDAEIAAMGVSLEAVNRRAPVQQATSISWPQVIRAARGESKARLGLFTSGSTGLPKLVWQPAANLARTVRVSPRQAEAVWALAYNPTHMAGIQVYLQALANGCPLVDVTGLDRNGIWEAIARHGITHLSATPSFFRLLLPAPVPCAGVHFVTLGGESADAGLLSRLQAAFPQAQLRNVYASTEAGALLVAEGDVFSIAPGMEGKVKVEESRIKVHRSLLGEFTGTDFSGDWYDTGDVAEMVSEQPLRFRIVARARDWVNVGGSKVNPREVEAVLTSHPAIREARVYARKNSVVGALLCAEVELAAAESGWGGCDGRPNEAALRAWLGERLQPHKVPRMIQFVDRLAVTRTGKLDRG